MSQSAGVSRPSLTNPADRENGGYAPSIGRMLSEPLTERDGVRLRREGTRETMAGTEGVTVREAVHRWRDYIRDKEGTSPTFMDDETGALAMGSHAHRWTEDYENREYAKLNDLERGIRASYGKLAHTVLLSLSGSSTFDDGAPRPPLDHLADVLAGYDPAIRALRRVMDERGLEYEYVGILEPHKSGYIHVHLAVFVRGVVTAEMFRPVVEAHLRNCPIAGEEAHQIRPDEPQRSAVSVNRVGTDRETGDLENLASYLAEYLGTFGGDPLDAPVNVQVANAVMWLSGHRRRRASNGAQRYMASPPQESDTSWVFVGITDETGELHEAPGGGGGVDMVTTWTADRGPPPPSREVTETRQSRFL